MGIVSQTCRTGRQQWSRTIRDTQLCYGKEERVRLRRVSTRGSTSNPRVTNANSPRPTRLDNTTYNNTYPLPPTHTPYVITCCNLTSFPRSDIETGRQITRLFFSVVHFVGLKQRKLKRNLEKKILSTGESDHPIRTLHKKRDERHLYL